MTTKPYQIQPIDPHNLRYLRYTQIMNGIIAFGAALFGIWILIDSTRRTDPEWVIWLLLSFGLLHTIEEYIYPGGFLPWFNHEVCDSPNSYLPLTAQRAFMTDGTAALVMLPILLLISIDILPIWVAFCGAMALYINAFLHISEWIRTARYSPGALTSIFVIIPAFSWIAFFYLSQSYIHPLELFGAFLGGILFNVLFYSALRRWAAKSE